MFALFIKKGVNMLKDFIRVAAMPQEVIEKYTEVTKNIKSITTYSSNYTIKHYIASNSTLEKALTSEVSPSKSSIKFPQQPKIVFIDSIQECFDGKPASLYNKLIETFPNTLFIGISQTDSKGNPKGAVANKFYWLSQNRIFVKDFRAYIEKTRTGANELEPYLISAEKAQERDFKLLKTP